MQLRPVIPVVIYANIVADSAPQFRLPQLFDFNGLFPLQHVLTTHPVIQPVGTIHRVLIKQVGEPSTQLIQLAAVVVVRGIVLKRSKVRVVLNKLGQQAH